MFMWALLAWKSFIGGVVLWTKDLIAQKIANLRTLPPGMERLYFHILRAVDECF